MKKIDFPKPKKDPLRSFPTKMQIKTESFIVKKNQVVELSLVEGAREVTIDVNGGSRATLKLSGSFNPLIFSTCSIRATVQKNATLEITESLFGGNRIDTEMIIELRGEGAECNVTGRFHGTDESHHGFFIIMRHKSPNTKGNIALRGVYEGTSRALFSGLIKVEKKAQKTNSYFRDDVLLLDQAIAESLPTLEIEANDVKASHGSTTSRINDEQIFYLQSRGIVKPQARRMVIDGFLGK